MRMFLRAAFTLMALLCLTTSALAEPLVSIVFSGNTWGYFKPCPT